MMSLRYELCLVMPCLLVCLLPTFQPPTPPPPPLCIIYSIANIRFNLQVAHGLMIPLPGICFLIFYGGPNATMVGLGRTSNSGFWLRGIPVRDRERLFLYPLFSA